MNLGYTHFTDNTAKTGQSAICRNIVDEQCSKCQADSSLVTCEIIWGACGHSFHDHCMQLWLTHATQGKSRVTSTCVLYVLETPA
ncbi:unnamed protein product [Oikopleura dioica]|uniref:Zinc finger RING-H2-type domain-containing protein n=1 Tax=Oikopleura dioica TaxID=34765 RepID=E4X8R9_OIKDI|nr:unnamed protein product [Oikopleura dioica]